jgi:hypothetical protein
MHYGWCGWGGRSARPRQIQAGRGILQANFVPLQGIMTGDGKLTTSHPVTECRNQTAQSLLGRAFRAFWRKSNNLHIGHMNDAESTWNSGAKPRFQALVARLYCFLVQFLSMRHILISVGFSFF